MDEILLLQKTAFQMLNQEQSKPEGQRDQKLILSIMAEASKLNERLVSLASGSPILAQLSAMLQGGRQLKQPQQIEQEEEQRLALLSPRIHSQILSIEDPDRRREVEQALIAANAEGPDDTDGNEEDQV